MIDWNKIQREVEQAIEDAYLRGWNAGVQIARNEVFSDE